MRDGKVVAADAALNFDRDRLVATMGAAPRQTVARQSATTAPSSGPVSVRARPARQMDGRELVARRGEIIGLAGLAGHGQTDLLLDIYRAAGRMRELLTDLARAASGAGDIPLVGDLQEVMESAIEAASAGTDQGKFKIVLDLPVKVELPMVRTRMERVFINLITNSMEAMPGGGTIRLAARRAGRTVLVEVEDTGPGIPWRIRDRLFEPFVTADK